jgi:hypothetical protein
MNMYSSIIVLRYRPTSSPYCHAISLHSFQVLVIDTISRMEKERKRPCPTSKDVTDRRQPIFSSLECGEVERCEGGKTTLEVDVPPIDDS